MLNAVFGIWKFNRQGENRRFQDTLTISINHLDRFPKEAEAYINDNFSFRSPLLDIYHSIKFNVYKVSPHPEKTIIGKDGWYFMAKDEKDIFEGRRDFDDKTLEAFAEKWQSRIAYYDSMNIKTYWLICPFKHYVYEDKLPFTIYRSPKERRVDVLERHLKERVPSLTILNPLKQFVVAKERQKLYYQLDNHWNFSAGEFVSQIIMDRIQQDFPQDTFLPLASYSWKDSVMHRGIHHHVISQPQLSETQSFPVLEGAKATRSEGYGFPVQKGFPYPDQYEIVYQNKAAGAKKKLLFIRDSFSDHLIPFISDPFRETVYIFDFWEYKRNPAIVETVKPDIIVFSSLETHIESILKHD